MYIQICLRIILIRSCSGTERSWHCTDTERNGMVLASGGTETERNGMKLFTELTEAEWKMSLRLRPYPIHTCVYALHKLLDDDSTRILRRKFPGWINTVFLCFWIIVFFMCFCVPKCPVFLCLCVFSVELTLAYMALNMQKHKYRKTQKHSVIVFLCTKNTKNTVFWSTLLVTLTTALQFHLQRERESQRK